jgi:hypothetical protein
MPSVAKRSRRKMDIIREKIFCRNEEKGIGKGLLGKLIKLTISENKKLGIM